MMVSLQHGMYLEKKNVFVAVGYNLISIKFYVTYFTIGTS